MQCWDCKKNSMEPAPELGAGWFKCPCGATWIELPKPGQPALTMVEDIGLGETSYSPRRGRKSKATKRG